MVIIGLLIISFYGTLKMINKKVELPSDSGDFWFKPTRTKFSGPCESYLDGDYTWLIKNIDHRLYGFATYWVFNSIHWCVNNKFLNHFKKEP